MTAIEHVNESQRSPARRPRDRSKRLVAAARELFRQHGYHGVGVNDIAAAAGVSGPALYRHFASKQELLAQVLLIEVRTLHDAVETVLDAEPAGSPRRLPRLASRLAELSIELRDATALWRWQGIHLAPEGRRAVRDETNTTMARLTGELRRHRPELTAADADMLCWAAISVLGSVAAHRTRIAKRRYVTLLTSLTLAVLHADLTVGAVAPAPASATGTDAFRPTRRETLLTEAARLFAERGFHAVSMEEIGQAAGVAAASVYRHYSGKTDLLLTGCRRMADRLAADASRALDTAGGPGEALPELLTSYVDTFLRNIDLVTVYTGQVHNLPGPDRAELVRLQRAYVAQWVAQLREVRGDLDESDARVAVHAALTVINDIARTRRMRARPAIRAELITLAGSILTP